MLNSSNLSSVVSIGGGTGLSCLLKGLKYSVLDFPEPPLQEAIPWISRLTAVVTVTDDGGSSGRLRNELKVLPPGDIRNCLVALSMDESLLSHLFQYRFTGRGHLRGHSFGNLFLTALTGVTGDFLKAIQVSSDVLATRGRIYPSTLEDVRLEAVLQDGTNLIGESAVAAARGQVKKIALTPGRVRPVAPVLEAIRTADVVTIGPGSLFTSLIPNLLVKGICREIKRSKALKLYIGNLMTQPGETTGFRASDHIRAIKDHTGSMFFDGIILNNKTIAGPVLSRYRREGAAPVQSDIDTLERMGLRVFKSNLLAQGKVVRHDPALLANAVYRAVCHRKNMQSPLKTQSLSGSL